ncbi:MAG: hypothetical protein ACOC1I_08965 [Spirochaetota bacterium]
MSVQPIDLQVLFSRLSQVGREQAAQRDAQVQAQAVAGSEIAERSEERDHRVSELSAQEEGPDTVNDEKEGNQSGSGHKRQTKDEEQEQDEIFRDPDLGQHIDISG